MADKFMYISDDDTQSQPFCRLHLKRLALNFLNQPIKIQ